MKNNRLKKLNKRITDLISFANDKKLFAKKLSKILKKFIFFFFFPDSEIDAKIKNLLASDDWKSKTGDRGATVLTRKLSLGLFGEEVLRHGSVKGKCGYRLDTYLLGKIKS